MTTKLRRIIPWALAALVALFLCACEALSPGQQDAVGAVLTDMLHEGKLTQAQYDALMQALHTGNMDTLLQTALEVGASVLMALLGVRVWRGGITSRKGEVPIMTMAPVAVPVEVKGNGAAD